MKRFGAKILTAVFLMTMLLSGCGGSTAGTNNNTGVTDTGSLDPNGDGIVGNDGNGYNAGDAVNDAADNVGDAVDDMTDGNVNRRNNTDANTDNNGNTTTDRNTNGNTTTDGNVNTDRTNDNNPKADKNAR